jgi:tRNA A-37 threonylcarbamoyl transferase component Bud32
MGVVYLAREGNLRRKVALKHAAGTEKEATRLRFVAEAQITAQLDHPGIVPVYALEQGANGGLAYSMKVVRGETLADRIDAARAHYERGGPADPELCAAQRSLLEKLVRVCEAVQFAHARGVIHRDLKPENIMLGAHGEVYVMDWGLAKVVGRPESDDEADADSLAEVGDLPADTRTFVGAIKGTPLYMAPEQAKGEIDRLGPHSDVYALGMILHEIAFLQKARRAKTIHSAVYDAQDNKLGEPPEDLDRSPEVRAIAAWATRTALAERPSARELGQDLTRVLRGEETRALPDEGLRKLRRAVVQHPTRFLGLLSALAILVLVVAGGGFAWHQVAQAEERLAVERRERSAQAIRSRADEGLDNLVKHFLYYGSLSAHLSASTARVLEHGDPGELRAHPPSAFERAEGAPAGTASAAGYGGRPVSPRALVGRSAPGVDPAASERDLRLLSHLWGPLREAFLAGTPGALGHWKPLSLEEGDAKILAHDVPLEWAYVALERTGSIVLFPGASSAWDADYDPRKRPWYQAAKAAYEERGLRRNWSQPYDDLMGQGIVMTFTEVVLDQDGRFAGLVALDLDFEAAARAHLAWTDLAGFHQATIIDGAGKVFMRSGALAGDLREDGTLDLGAYQDGEVLAAIQAGEVDHLLRGDRVTLWVQQKTLGWTLVVDVDARALEEHLQTRR